MKNNKFFCFKTFSVGVVWFYILTLSFAPFILTFIVSFLTPNKNSIADIKITTDNYFHLLNPIYLKILLQTLALTISTTALCLVIGYPFAYILGKYKGKFKYILLMLVIIPFWTSSLVRIYSIMAILKTNGVLNMILMRLGIIHHPLQILYSYTAVLIGCVYDLLPLMILPIYANVEKLDSKLIEVAKDLGAGKIRTFVSVVAPLTFPGIVAGTILVFLPAATMFYIPVLLGGAKNMLLGNLIEHQFLSVNNFPLGSATSIVITVIICAILFVYMKKTKDSEQGLF